ncbi:phenylalanine--tRNA ligase subunit alpha [Tunturiibacter empetritectus]|uniref:Phenylalanine--tRNA ligase alpha subunit n=1 Tax=Tunturiibacter lichenicola TaxID=2051959 RepID=A0A852V9D5_9BACT|nr:phenylalanine--tRNA ligase subunit alpha [Edaphobacter lichenicola]NYF87941.1 phenylalanyl-tRNA synthetase alpha chain [Edaphobacter lichenicola]
MSEQTIPSLSGYEEPTLEAAFITLSEEVRTTAAETAADPEAFRLHWLGRKQGRLKLISEAWLKSAPPEAKKALGIRFNELKALVEYQLSPERLVKVPVSEPGLVSEYATQGGTIAASLQNKKHPHPLDITLPGTLRAPGIPHPLLKTMHEIVSVFHHLGYSTNLGPQVESDFYNFEALNFPENHPARDTQDTLVIANQQSRPSRDRLLMRTHTSPVQIRTMIAQAPPIRIVIPGKVHRNDAADATHSPIFHQIEGLCVDTNITFSDLKGTLDHAMKALFGSDVKTRFFPSFFPFTEPSADVQISCIFCGGKGCRKCKHSGWIELLGCGMVDPAVFAAVIAERRKINPADNTYNPEKITGFAFGMGVERIAMMLHGVSDIGHFYSGDMRFLEQFA